MSRWVDKHWNRCDYCGKFIAMKDFGSGAAERYLLTPDTYFSSETYRTLCPKCKAGSDKRKAA